MYIYIYTTFKNSGSNIIVLCNQFAYYFCYVKFERPSVDTIIFLFNYTYVFIIIILLIHNLVCLMLTL